MKEIFWLHRRARRLGLRRLRRHLLSHRTRPLQPDEVPELRHGALSSARDGLGSLLDRRSLGIAASSVAVVTASLAVLLCPLAWPYMRVRPVILSRLIYSPANVRYASEIAVSEIAQYRRSEVQAITQLQATRTQLITWATRLSSYLEEGAAAM